MLNRLPRRTNEIAQSCNVGPVSADAPGIHRQTKAFSQIQVEAGVVQFRQAESRCGQNTIDPRRVDRPGRTMTLPGPARQLVKLFPIAFVPGRHLLLSSCRTVPGTTAGQYELLEMLDASFAVKVLSLSSTRKRAPETPRATDILHNPRGARHFLALCSYIVSNPSLVFLFRQVPGTEESGFNASVTGFIRAHTGNELFVRLRT